MLRKLVVVIILLNFLFSGFRTYETKNGDSYYTIGNKFHINYVELAKINGNKKLTAGTSIKIPMYFNYKIRKGDSYIKLSKKFKIPLKKIQQINKNKNLLYGLVIRIPKSYEQVFSKSPKKNVTIVKKPLKTKQKTIHQFKKPKVLDDYRKLKFVWPASGKIDNKYGEDNSIFSYGLTFDVNKKNIISTEIGVVSFVGKIRGLGKTLIISHPHNFYSLYSGIKEVSITEGTRVNRGKKIAITENKLFFSIFESGSPYDPLKYIK